MTYDVPALTIHYVLQSLGDSSGAYYESLLTEAGLSRFLQHVPEATWEPVATRAELVALFAAVYHTLGPVLTRNFLRTWGRFTGNNFAQTEIAQAMKAEADQVPPDARLAWFVHALADFSARTWAPHILSEDAEAWYCEMDPCPVCLQIRGATQPICGDVEGMYSTLAQHIIGRRVVVEEVACAAAGAPRCKWAYYKNR
jgi:hypothetical protein